MPQVTKNLRDGTLIILGGQGAGVEEVIVALEEGDLSFGETRNIVNVSDRGALDHMRKGDEEPVSLSFTLKFIEFFSQDGASAPTPYEALTQRGDAATWETSNTDGGDVYTTDLNFYIASPTTDEDDEKIIFLRVPGPGVEFSEGDEYNTLAFDGIAFMTEVDIEKCEMSCETNSET